MLQWEETAIICSYQKHHLALSVRNIRQTERVALTNKFVSLQVLDVRKGEEKVRSVPAKEDTPSRE